MDSVYRGLQLRREGALPNGSSMMPHDDDSDSRNDSQRSPQSLQPPSVSWPHAQNQQQASTPAAAHISASDYEGVQSDAYSEGDADQSYDQEYSGGNFQHLDNQWLDSPAFGTAAALSSIGGDGTGGSVSGDLTWFEGSSSTIDDLQLELSP